MVVGELEEEGEDEGTIFGASDALVNAVKVYCPRLWWSGRADVGTAAKTLPVRRAREPLARRPRTDSTLPKDTETPPGRPKMHQSTQGWAGGL